MKTSRRQELKTNELSQQIEQAGDYLKDNAMTIIITIIVAAVIVGGGFWYVGQKDRALTDAWNTLDSQMAGETESAEEAIARYEAVARENLEPGVTAAAWLRVGDRAMQELTNPAPEQDPLATGTEPSIDYAAKAREAFNKIVTQYPNNLTATGHAMACLAVLEEDAGNTEKAREWYKRILDDKRYEAYPYHNLANTRLAGLSEWSTDIVFPPPAPEPAGPPAPLDLDQPGNIPNLTRASIQAAKQKPANPRVEKLDPTKVDISDTRAKKAPEKAPEAEAEADKPAEASEKPKTADAPAAKPETEKPAE